MFPRLLLALTALSPILIAQTASRLQFETTSVKQPAGDGMMGVEVGPGGRVTVRRFPLKTLIGTAFGLGQWQISGGERWMGEEEYVVEGTPPEDLRGDIGNLRYSLFRIENARLREMLQSLLIERFGLRFHFEKTTGDVFLLERATKPLALTRSAAGADARSDIGYAGGCWRIFQSRVQDIAQFASAYVLRTTVIDETKLDGAFDYRQKDPDPEPNYADNRDSFLRMISEVGLKLVKTRGPVETFVIDSARKPEPN